MSPAATRPESGAHGSRDAPSRGPVAKVMMKTAAISNNKYNKKTFIIGFAAAVKSIIENI